MTRLLIVDDSRVMRNRIARLCASGAIDGLVIAGEASNGREAIEAAQRIMPECITMDLTMPEMDGETSIAALSTLLPGTRILVVSALSDKATALRAIRKGAHGFLHKPFTDAQLLAALRELLS